MLYGRALGFISLHFNLSLSFVRNGMARWAREKEKKENKRPVLVELQLTNDKKITRKPDWNTRENEKKEGRMNLKS